MPSYVGYDLIGEKDLEHHGILGQKWGQRNGPPYPLKGGDYSKEEIRQVYKARRRDNSIYNKKHFDKVISTSDTLATLSYDKHRTENTDMFYAAYKKPDKHQYNALFNKKVPQTLYDENGEEIGTGMFYKYRINNTVKHDVKVASEDSAAKVFTDLFANNRDFYNFVTDPERMQSHFVDSKYKFKGYREARKSLERIRDPENKPTERDLRTVYRMFNYVIPSDGAGNARAGKDVAVQRQKFFNALKKAGYGACLDTNDAIYGGFKAQAPVIVFDMEQISLKNAERVTTGSKLFSDVVFSARKSLGL